MTIQKWLVSISNTWQGTGQTGRGCIEYPSKAQSVPRVPEKNKKALFISGGQYMRRSEKKELIQSESIRIRFSEKQKKRLFEEKSRTGRSVSDIVRQGVDEYFKRKI